MTQTTPEVPHKRIGECEYSGRYTSLIHHVGCQYKEGYGHQWEIVHTVHHFQGQEGDRNVQQVVFSPEDGQACQSDGGGNRHSHYKEN